MAGFENTNGVCRQKVYIACEYLDMIWDEKEVADFESMWRGGLHISDIARAFNRDVDEIGLLVIDQARLGTIERRNNGIQGQRMPDECEVDGDGSQQASAMQEMS